MLEYLKTASESQVPASQIQDWLHSKGLQIVTKPDLECLGRAEEQEAKQRGILWFKFAADEAMLAAIAAEKAKAVTV